MRLYYDNAGTWVRISAIVDFPNIASRANVFGLCTAVLRDFEGGLYPTWIDRDFTKMLVTDDAAEAVGDCNIIFRGQLIAKKYSSKTLILTIAGIGELLERKSFGSEEEVNYILAEGNVKEVPGGTSTGRIFNILPTGDGVCQLHVAEGRSDHYAEVDEYSGDLDITTFVFADNTDEGEYDSFIMENDNDDIVNEVTGVTIWSYARNNATLGNNELAYVDISWDNGDTWEGDNKQLNLQTTYAWRQSAWTELSKTQADLNNLRIKFIANGELEIGEQQYLAAIFVRVTYNGKNPSAIDLYADADVDGVYDEGEDFEWDTDRWILGDKNVGLLIIDNTGDYSEREWDSSELIVTGDNDRGGDNDGTLLFDDDPEDFYWAKDTTEVPNLVINPVIDGIVLPGVGDDNRVYLKKIEIRYSFRLRIFGSAGVTAKATAKLQILRGTTWDDVSGASIDLDRFGASGHTSAWVSAVPAGVDGHTKMPVIISGTDAELQEYFNTDVNDDYSALKGLRFKLTDGHLPGDSYANIYVDYIKVLIHYHEFDVDKIMHPITDSGASWVECDSIESFNQLGITEATDAFQIGQNTVSILNDVGTEAGLNIEVVNSAAFTKYMARKFKGKHCIDVLDSVCKLEGAYWIEDYINNRIVIIKPADYTDSGITLTAGGITDWEYEDKCNQVKKVFVWGKTSFNKDFNITVNIKYKAEDPDVVGDRSEHIIDDSINSLPDAAEVAETQLALLKNKRPSIRIPLNGVNADLQLGTYANLTMVRPTVDSKDYPIRMIQRSKFGKTGIKTIVHFGLGETKDDEKFFTEIRKIISDTHRLESNNLTSKPYETGVGGLGWGDITGADAGAVAAIDADDTIYTKVETDALIPVAGDFDHDDIANPQGNANEQHLTAAQVAQLHDDVIVSVANVEAVITAEIVGGQSIDNAIDALIAALVDAAGAVAAVAAADDYLKNDANDETSGDLTVANLITAGLVDTVDVSALKTAFDALDYYTQAQVDAAVATKDTKEEAHAYVEANALTLTEDLTMGAGKDIDLAAGRTVDGVDVSGIPATVTAVEDRFDEQSDTFPVAPSEGDLHYSEVLDSWYRYNGEAEAWVEVGVGGLVVESIDNLGNHTATEDLDMDANDIINCKSLSSNVIGYPNKWEFISNVGLKFKISNDNNDYLYFHTPSNIPNIGGVGDEAIYFYDPVAENWNTLHADDFTPHSSPMPIELSTEKILKIKNNEDNSKLDYSTIPIDTYFIDKNKENEGYKMNRMMLHLIKTIQELETRIKELEK